MKVLLSLIICIALYSCSKEPDNPPPAKNILGSVQYKVNGQLVTVNNKNIESGEFILFSKQLRDNFLVETRYLVKAEKAINNAFVFAIVSDSLQQITYHYDSAGVNNQPTGFVLALAFEAQESEIVYGGDYFDITITYYKNTRISGTFSAKLTPEKNLFDYNDRGTTIISDGVFNEIPLTH